MTATNRRLYIEALITLAVILLGLFLVSRIPAQTRCIGRNTREICECHHVKYDKRIHGCYIGSDAPYWAGFVIGAVAGGCMTMK